MSACWSDAGLLNYIFLYAAETADQYCRKTIEMHRTSQHMWPPLANRKGSDILHDNDQANVAKTNALRV